MNKRIQMDSFLSDHKPDIVLIAETNLSPRNQVAFRNYNFQRTDKITGRRGTGILTKNNIASTPVNTAAWNLSSLETTASLIRTVNDQHFLVVSAYRYTSRSILDVKDLDIIVNASRAINGCSLILGGDFNARHEHWYNTNRCSSGTALYQWLIHDGQANGINIAHTFQPTFYKGTYSSFLDFFLLDDDLTIKFQVSNHNLLSLLDYPSDHRAVELVISIDSCLEREPMVSIPLFSETNWNLFNQELDISLDSVFVPNHRNMSPVEIDDAVEMISDIISSTMDNQIPKREIHPNSQIPLPPDLLVLIAEKKRLRRQWHRNRYNFYAHALKSQIACITKIIDDRVLIARREHWELTLSNVKLDNHTFQNIKRFAGINRRSKIPPLTNPLTNVTESLDLPKATLLAEHFEKVHSQNDQMGDPVFTEFVNRTIRSEFDGSFHPQIEFSQEFPANPSVRFNPDHHLFSFDSLCAIIKSRANKKSKGPDNIPNIVLKKLSKKCLTMLVILFNQSFNLGYFPKAWKEAVIIPIPKKGKPPNEVSSFRPIALLCGKSKVFECGLKNVVVFHCEDNDVLPDDQFGFRSGRSTTHALVKLQTDVAMKLNNRVPTIACALDIEKAFDTAWTEGLIYKMLTVFNFPRHICKLVYEYLTDRSFCVAVGKDTSRYLPIRAGVPQGGVLSAVLYIIYIADIPNPAPHRNPIQRLQYADDTLLYVSTKNLQLGQDRLNTYLATLHEYFNKWRIKLNPSKAEAVVFKPLAKHCTRYVNQQSKNIRLLINGHPIPLQASIKYLGIIFNHKFSFVQQITYITEKAHRTLGSLRGVLKRTSRLSIKIKLLCYKQLLRPIISYGFLSWCHISSAQMERLRCLERKLLRMCVNYRRSPGDFRYISNSALYRLASINRLDTHLLDSGLKYLQSWPDCDILQQCVIEDGPYMDDLQHPYKPAWYLKYLNDTGQIYNGNVPIYYHRRFKTNPHRDNIVYSTGV